MIEDTVGKAKKLKGVNIYFAKVSQLIIFIHLSVTFNIVSDYVYKLMEAIQEKIIENFGNRLRVRVCGVLIEDNQILLVNHHSLREKGDFWIPPGGGMDFGTSAEENLIREFVEETGLEIEVVKFLFVHEYLHSPLHAIELIFEVKRTGGKVKKGFDPEMPEKEQIIKDVKFVSMDELEHMPKNSLHQMFSNRKILNETPYTSGYALSKD